MLASLLIAGLVVLALVLVLAAIGARYVLLRWRKRRRRIEAPELIPEPRQHTILLCHGILGFDERRVLGRSHHYFRGISEHLLRNGAAVHTARVSALGTVPERAKALASIVEELDSRRIVIVAHSMGGLDARFAISTMGISERVSALVSVGTPHRGSCLANVASHAPIRILRALLGRAGLATDALDWLGELASVRFNEEVSDVDSVQYGCIVGETSRVRVMANPVLLACFELLTKLRGPNDGVVPASSQRWGKVIKVVPAHHFGQIGWSPLFDARSMYLGLLAELDAGGLPCLPNKRSAPRLGSGSL